MTAASVEPDDAAVPPFAVFMAPVLRVLSDERSRTTQELREDVYAEMRLTPAQRDFVHEKSGQRRADVRIGFATSHLRRAGAVEGGYGVVSITDVGQRLLREHGGGLSLADLEGIPAYRDYIPQKEGQPGSGDEDALLEESDDGRDPDATYWFVGASFEDLDTGEYRDHTGDFIRENRWRIHPDSPQRLKDYVAVMRSGDRIAVKSVYVRKQGVPFETHGHPVSVMDIKATGTILGPTEDGLSVPVCWEQDFTADPRTWYLFTFQKTIWRVDPAERPFKAALVRFAFDGQEQDLDAFRNDPYWADRFGDDASTGPQPAGEVLMPSEADEDPVVEDEAPSYTVEDVIADGCFLGEEALETFLRTWEQKKNLILQGPPGTGKTWLAKRLACVLVGSADTERITAVQFHPTVSYEDFVRGWRPSGDGRLTLVDGVLLQIAQRAAAEPDRVHVLVIEEINRGNLAQIFGEMLTLLEADKRTADQAMQLTYRREGEGPFSLPENLYVVGTMNLADRSLAMVDFALRRRFGFVDLMPQYELSWQSWVAERVVGAGQADIARLGDAVKALNTRIAAAPGLGEQYRIGHSFLTPAKTARNVDFRPWAESVIRQEIQPLLTEYWFDQPALVEEAVADLLAALPAGDA